MTVSRMSFGLVLLKTKSIVRPLKSRGHASSSALAVAILSKVLRRKMFRVTPLERWFSFQVKDDQELCILESDKRLPDHIRKMDIFGKVTCHMLRLFV